MSLQALKIAFTARMTLQWFYDIYKFPEDDVSGLQLPVLTAMAALLGGPYVAIRIMVAHDASLYLFGPSMHPVGQGGAVVPCTWERFGGPWWISLYLLDWSSYNRGQSPQSPGRTKFFKSPVCQMLADFAGRNKNSISSYGCQHCAEQLHKRFLRLRRVLHVTICVIL